MTDLDHYQVLGVEPTVNEKDLRKAYKKLCQKYHPDKDENNSEHFRRIRKAYDVLSDPQRRVVYDQGIKQGINPEEFNKVLQAICVKVVLMTFQRLSERPSGNFLREAHRALATEKAEVSVQLGLIRQQYDLVIKHIDSIKEGQDTHIVKTAIRKAGELKAAKQAGDVTLAVMEYMLEDSKRIVCPEEYGVQAPRLLGGTVFFNTDTA